LIQLRKARNQSFIIRGINSFSRNLFITKRIRHGSFFYISSWQQHFWHSSIPEYYYSLVVFSWGEFLIQTTLHPISFLPDGGSFFSNEALARFHCPITVSTLA
jgi:hypothetical protein